MKVSDDVRGTIKEEVAKLFNDSKTVAFLENILDEEYNNAENISVLIDRIEELEAKVDSLESQKESA